MGVRDSTHSSREVTLVGSGSIQKKLTLHRFTYTRDAGHTQQTQNTKHTAMSIQPSFPPGHQLFPLCMSVDTVTHRYYTCRLSSSDPNTVHCTAVQTPTLTPTGSSISLSTLFPEWTDRWRLNLRFPSQRVVNDSIDKK